METVTDISEGQLLKKDYILTNETDFLAGGNNFLSFSATNFFHFLYCLKKLKKMVSTSQKISYIS